MPKYRIECPKDPDLAFGADGYEFALVHARSMSELHPELTFDVYAQDGYLVSYRAGQAVHMTPESDLSEK